MTEIPPVTDAKGRKVAVLVDLKKHGAGSKTCGTAWFRNRDAKNKGIPPAKV